MFAMKNRETYNGICDPTANRLAALNEIGKLKTLSYEERLKKISASGWTSFNWAEKLLASAER